MPGGTGWSGRRTCNSDHGQRQPLDIMPEEHLHALSCLRPFASRDGLRAAVLARLGCPRVAGREEGLLVVASPWRGLCMP